MNWQRYGYAFLHALGALACGYAACSLAAAVFWGALFCWVLGCVPYLDVNDWLSIGGLLIFLLVMTAAAATGALAFLRLAWRQLRRSA